MIIGKWKGSGLFGRWTCWFLVLLALLGLSPSLRAGGDEEWDSYKVKISGFWFYSSPSGNVQGSSNNGVVDLQTDLSFNNYSTFSGKVDWRFKRKHHLYLAASPLDKSKQTILSRSFDFQGQHFDAGLTAQSNLKALLFAPGYQYDIIRRKRGHLGIGLQVDLFDTNASIHATGTVNGVARDVTASGSLLAPIPVAGPEFRLYLTNSPRVFVEGNLYGMYFFGYGDFVSTTDTIGIRVSKHVSVNVGYQLGTRLIVNNSSSSARIGLHLTQQGAVAGAEFSF
jgi:hypothetical protein